MNIKRLMEIGCYRGHAAPPQPAGARPAHAHQRAHAQGSAQGRGREEEDGVAMAKNDPIDASAPPEGGKKGAGKPTKKKTFKKRGEKRIVHHGFAHIQASFNNTIVTITDTEGQRDRVVERRRASASRARARARRSRRRRRRSPPATPPRRSACARVEVRVKGPGSGRESAIRALQTIGHRGEVDPRRHADSAQRLPAAEAPSRVERRTCRMRTIDGSLHRTGLPAVPARRHEALPQGRALLHGEVRDREAQLRRPGSTASRARRSSSATACSCARSRRSSASTACSRTSSAATSRRPSGTRGITGETLLQLLERRLDNVIYRLGLATSRPQARQLVRHGHFPVNGKKVDIPSYSVQGGRRRHRARHERRRTPTIEHAMEEVKGRGIPEWLSFDRRRPDRPHRVAADARADQPARAGTADRRAVFEVAAQLSAASLTARPLPAAFPDLRREAGGSTAGLAGAQLRARRSKGQQRHALERFSAAQAARVRARDADRPVRPVLRAAVRARLRHDHRQRACGACCCRRSKARPSPRSRSTACCTSSRPIPGVVEDATDIILNLKQIPLKMHTDTTKTLYLRVDKPGEVQGARHRRPTPTSRSSSPTRTSRRSPRAASSTWRCASSAAAATSRPTRTSTRISASAGSRSTRCTRRSRRSTTSSRPRASARRPTTTS